MQIHALDNVEVRSDGKKYALRFIGKGENVIKYGFPIGHATKDINEGELVYSENLHSNLAGRGEWKYNPTKRVECENKTKSFLGYLRDDGSVGIRNELWIIPTVGCINDIVKKLAKMSGAKALTHPYGCSQLGDDLLTTQKILCGLIKHPNAGGVLVLGLGCENNGIGEMKKVLGNYNEERVKFLNIQDCEDEIESAMSILNELKLLMKNDTPAPQPISKLRIAVKCGGSDGYSGITANPLVGRAMELHASFGGTVLMSEIPEMFGAEELLLSRSKNEQVFESASEMIQNFRQYFIEHGEGISDNPSPGNIAGGITTLEEKSLGCVQKAGNVSLNGALDYGEAPISDGGLYIVNGPGNDMVAVTNLAAAGANIILFTTGRGTPLSSVVPTLKISTNTPLAKRKPHWIDFDAGEILDGKDMDELSHKLYELCINVAQGQKTLSEEMDFYDLAIFKNGVTL